MIRHAFGQPLRDFVCEGRGRGERGFRDDVGQGDFGREVLFEDAEDGDVGDGGVGGEFAFESVFGEGGC